MSGRPRWRGSTAWTTRRGRRCASGSHAAPCPYVFVRVRAYAAHLRERTQGRPDVQVSNLDAHARVKRADAHVQLDETAGQDVATNVQPVQPNVQPHVQLDPRRGCLAGKSACAWRAWTRWTYPHAMSLTSSGWPC